MYKPLRRGIKSALRTHTHKIKSNCRSFMSSLFWFVCIHLLCFNRLFPPAALSCPLHGPESSSRCLKIFMNVDTVILLQQQLSATSEWRRNQTTKPMKVHFRGTEDFRLADMCRKTNGQLREHVFCAGMDKLFHSTATWSTMSPVLETPGRMSFIMTEEEKLACPYVGSWC